MCKGVGVHLLILSHFHRIFENEGQVGSSSEPHEPPLDPPLHYFAVIKHCIFIENRKGNVAV